MTSAPTPAPHAHPSVTRAQRFATALALLLVLAGLLLLVGWNRGWMRTRLEFVTLLPDNAGISRSSVVLLHGLAVGRVRETALVERDGTLRVEVRFWIDETHAAWLRRGSHVLVRNDLVEAARLELQPNLGSAERLPPGAELPATLAPNLMAQVLELQPTVKNLLGSVDRMISSINDRTARFDPILARVEKQLEAIDANLLAVTATVNEARGLLAQTKSDQAALTASLGQALRALNTELLPELTGAVRSNRTELETALGSLNRTLAELEKQLPVMLQLSRETLKNSADFTEAAAHTWPFSRYVLKKEAATKASGPPSPR